MGSRTFDITFTVDRLFPALIALLCLVVVPTTAATLDGGVVDRIGDGTDIILEPHNGPNGQKYVEIQDESEELTINITDRGVNTDSITTFDRLFTITNTGDSPREVWVTDSVSNESVIEVYTDDGATRIDDESSRISVAPNETITAGLRINTYDGAIDPGQVLQFTLIINARFLEDTDDDGIPDRDDACPELAEDFDEIEDDDGCPETDSFSENGTTVTYADSVTEDTLANAGIESRPLNNPELTTTIGRATPDSRSEQLRTQTGIDADLYTTTDTETVFVENTSVAATTGLGDRRMVKHVDIDVPQSLSKTSAAVSMTVPREDLGGSTATDLRVARYVDGDWTVLSTTVESAAPGSVTVTADASASGRFAVVTDPNRRYSWRVENETVGGGQQMRYNFTSEGVYSVSVTVTDDAGRTATDTVPVFADGRPTGRIDIVSKRDSSLRATLSGTSFNTLGGQTLTWQFPDGTIKTGEQVTHWFDTSTPTVQLMISDAYRETTLSRTFSFSGGTDSPDETDEELTNETEEGATNETSVEKHNVTVAMTNGTTAENVSIQELDVVEDPTPDGLRAEIRPDDRLLNGSVRGTVSADTRAIAANVSAANPNATLSADIRSQIQADPERSSQVQRATPEDVQRELDSQGANLLTLTRQETPLSGSHALFAEKTSVADNKRMIRHVSISVPPEQRNQATPIELDVSADQLGTTNASELEIAHNTDQGWELLETDVVEREDGTITVRAVTPGFSRFAVFAQNSVEFQWDVETFETPFTGQRINPTFSEPGIYETRLTVRDAFGLTDQTKYRILANDRPEVTIEPVSTDRTNRTATLAADVTNEVGNSTVTWLFPDGSAKTGQRVTHTFADDDTNVTVYAADSYGAIGTSETEIGFGRSLISFEAGIPIQLRYILASWIIGLMALVLRWRLAWIIGGVFVDHTPTIEAVERPTIDPRQDRINVAYLHVADSLGDLTEISLRVLTDAGDELTHTTIQCDRVDRYKRDGQVVLAEQLAGESGTYVLRLEATDEAGNTASAQRRIDAPGAMAR
jgi:hypothetical protein